MVEVCFNWSCARKQTLRLTAEDMSGVLENMMICSTDVLHDRLKRIRIGIWQMELLALKYQPLLANDRAGNDDDRGVNGRTDCIDNSRNTTTFLNILRDLSAIPGWSVSLPRVRDLFPIDQVHWTAVVVDQDSGVEWTVDSWFRPHGHLPFVLPLSAWLDDKKGWEPPFDELNPYPDVVNELCLNSSKGRSKGVLSADFSHRGAP